MQTILSISLTLICFTRFSHAQTTQPIPYDDNPATGKYYNINGFKMYTETYGDGPPLLMTTFADQK